MSHWVMYWIVQLDSISDSFCVMAVIFGIGSAIALLAIAANYRDSESHLFCRNKARKWLIAFGLPFLFCFILAVLTPRTKQMAAIYLVPAMVNNERIQDIGDKSLQVLQEKLNQWLDNISQQGAKRSSH